ncbi:MAG TPA: hypothetical protein VEC57_18355 [Candidatus Limnocylindrales bacterium]|nr:hypothetical protein [Candidatus Limnocylindrales bacterium]
MAEIEGTSGNDKLSGTAGSDTIRGRAGDDTLRGLAGDDTINGGSGLDRLLGGLGNDRLSAGKDDDTLFGEEGDDVLAGSIGADALDGDEGNDVLRGGSGPDTLDGRLGNDTLDGGAGNDTLRGGNDDDTMRGGAGNDDLLGAAGNDRLGGASGNDTLLAAAGSDVLDGGIGRDQLEAGSGDDLMAGGEGDDVVDGGEGRDTAVFEGDFADYSFDAGEDGAVIVTDDEPLLPAPGDDDGADTLTGVEVLQFKDRTTNGDGTNSFPEAGPDQTLPVPQDSAPVLLGIQEPIDPDGDDLRVQVLELPNAAFGTIRDLDGDPVLVADQPSVQELVRFTFTPAPGVSGEAGRFSFRVDDFNGGLDTQVVTIQIIEPEPGVIELGALNGNDGFVLEGVLEDDQLGSCVGGARDVDGDGFDDIVIGARMPVGLSQTGKAYVVFGSDMHTARRKVDLGDDFTVLGRGPKDRLGLSCAMTGDADGDGSVDLLIGARGVGSEETMLPPGEAFFLRGPFPRAGALDLSSYDEADGFRVEGNAPEDFAGIAVSGAGDFNADGLEDLLIGAPGVDAANAEERGEAYLLFGREGLDLDGMDLSEIDESTGLRLLGAARRDAAGGSVSAAGDVNGDGIDDIIIGTSYADPNQTRSGQSYVVFGSTEPSENGVLSLLDLQPPRGFTIDGAEAEQRSGFDVSGAGDVNGDGYDDVIVGAPGLSDFGESMGGAFVVYGGADVGTAGPVQLGSLGPQEGFLIRGVSAMDLAGTSVSSAGDFNNDGFDDVLIGAPAAEPNGPGSGAAYVVFGSEEGPAEGVIELFLLDGTDGIALRGPENGRVGNAVAAAGDVNNDGFADVVIGAAAASPKGRPLAGEVYVVFGHGAEDASAQAVAMELRMPADAASIMVDASLGAAVPGPAPVIASAFPSTVLVATTLLWLAGGIHRLRRRR